MVNVNRPFIIMFPMGVRLEEWQVCATSNSYCSPHLECRIFLYVFARPLNAGCPSRVTISALRRRVVVGIKIEFAFFLLLPLQPLHSR